jgi:hypothetical protein
MWSAVALVLSVALVVWRAEVLLRVFLPGWLAVQEAKVALERDVRTAKPERETIPVDLEAIALQETEAWAQEQVRAALLDAYESSQDWDSVRTQYHGVRA